MYTREEASRQRQAFWTTFGQYMQPILSDDGGKINWVNYKTGVPGISVKMDADERNASIAIVLSHADAALLQRHYEQLSALRSLLQDAVGEEWLWQSPTVNAFGKLESRVGTVIGGVNINRSSDWPEIISFLKPRIIAFDAFWSSARYSF